MPDTADHRADMHQLATERRAAGLPVWDRRINLADVFHDDGMRFEDKRDVIVGRLASWVSEYEEGDELPMLVEELADCETISAFDQVWDSIYDIADVDRVWLGTF